jgi:hypothetical protein
MNPQEWPDDDPDIRRAAQRQITLRGAGAGLCGRDGRQYRYSSKRCCEALVDSVAAIPSTPAHWRSA